jgi:membrane associated rhomboid family serine protease
MFNNLINNITPVVKNLLILNVLFFIAQITLPDIMHNLSLYPMVSEQFKPWQLATHFFMHGGIGHIFFNMFALVIFGMHLERVWGPKRFLTYYLVCAFGAAILHMIVNYIRIKNLESTFSPEELETIQYLVKNQGYELLSSNQNWVGALGQLNAMYNVPMIGASGAVFGLLAAFGYLFPNTELMLLFPPIPIKAKFFVIGYAALELYLGFSNNPNDNVAHFAHLGGALVGILLVLYWRKSKKNFF